MTHDAYTLETETHANVELVVATLSGRASFDLIGRLLGELAVRVPPRVLVDETYLRAGAITTGELRELARTWNETRAFDQSKVAIVAPSLLIYGLNRLAHAFAGQRAEERLAVFRQRGDALQWLAAT